jgi:outer membrane receptor for monomeric catechols
MDVTDMCVDGALIRYVGVSLSTVLTASKGNESELLTYTWVWTQCKIATDMCGRGHTSLGRT